MDLRGTQASINGFFHLLQTCIHTRDLKAGRELYCLIKRSGLESHTFLGGHVVRMFALCGSLLEANEVFSTLPTKNASAWSAIILAHAKLGKGEQAIKLYYRMQQSCVIPLGYAFVGVLKACVSIVSLQHGKLIHLDIIESNFDSDEFVVHALINTYVKCRSLNDARRVFDKVPKASTVAWNVMIAGYAHDLHAVEALQLFWQMQNEGLQPDNFTYNSILKVCSSNEYLDQGKLIHTFIIRRGFESDVYVGSTLIHMYGQCGNLEDAHWIFDRLLNRSVVTWNAMIAAYVQHEKGWEAFQLYVQMQQKGIQPTDVTFISILRACSSMDAPEQGKIIHALIIRYGFEPDVMIGTALIDMYFKCGYLEDARGVFEKLPERNIVVWSVMVAGYADHGHGLEAFLIFEQMQEVGLAPNDVTLVSLLKACTSVAALDKGKLIHARIVQSGYEEILGSTIIDLYVKCGNLRDSLQVFERLPKGSVVTWSAMIEGCAEHRYGQKALQLFLQMQQEGVIPNKVTFLSIMKACSSIEALDQGKLVHAQILESGFEMDVFVGNTLIDMYSKCGSITEAQRVFNRLSKHNVVTWNAMIAGNAQLGHGQEALRIFQQMQQKGIKENIVTLVSILKACCSMLAIDQGKLIHAYMVIQNCRIDVFLSSALIDLYAKCGCIEDAQRFFSKLSKRDLVAWNSIIVGYAQHGYNQEALQLFLQMQQEGVVPDNVTCVGILHVCSVMAALDFGRLVHAHVIKTVSLLNLHTGNALIDMYAKCGSLDDAHRVFDKMSEHDVVSWSTMVAGYAWHSDYKMALQYLENMQQEGLVPNNVTFVSLLSACSRVGLVNEAFHHFKTMTKAHGIIPVVDHYNSMVDILGRTGHLVEAEDLLQTTPFQTNTVGWTSLLSHCRTHGDVELGRHCFDQFVTINFRHASGYMLMSSVYVGACMWEDVYKIQGLRRRAEAWKKPGKASVEVDNKVNNFIAGVTSHPYINDISAKLTRLGLQIKLEGHMPYLDLALQQIENDVNLCDN